ncbi:MAG: xanthine dehydrogenase family protein molybdopterin-binding subunit [Acidobacteriota bacterium]
MEKQKKYEYVVTEVEIEGRVIKTIAAKVPELPVWGKTEVVGKEIHRVDGNEIVTGKAKYTFDVSLPSMLYGAILRSPYPHAKINNINIDKALKIPGVKAVITANDTGEMKLAGGLPIFVKEETKYSGEEIAAVAAITRNIAEEAVRAIEVDFTPLPFVIDPEEAMKPGALEVVPGGNIGNQFRRGRVESLEPSVYQRGDVEKGFSEADFIIEENFSTEVSQHATMELHGTVAYWKGDKLTVWESTQGVFGVQEAIANTLNHPFDKIRVIGTYMGGGFGSKNSAGKYTIIAALLSKKTGKPVKVILSRKEDFEAPNYRPPSKQYLKIGVKKDGTITSLSMRSINQIGAYPVGIGLGSCEGPVQTLYNIPNLKTESYAVFTHTPTPLPMRAPGYVQGTWALEQIMDIAAEKIGMDPVEFRLKNIPEVDPQSGKPYASHGLKECLILGREKFEWEKKKKIKKEIGDKNYGIGLACQIWFGGGGPPANAIIKVNQDGSINLITGAADLGTGTRTVLSQIVAEELKIPVKSITVTNADTETTPYTLPSYGSITVASSGPAVRQAAYDVKLQILSMASIYLEEDMEKLDIKDGIVFVKDKPEKNITFALIARRSPGRMLIGKGERGPNPDKSLKSVGAHFAEVEIDRKTGEVKILKYLAAHDSGRVINPKTWKSQIYGGIAMGIGYGLLENRIMDRRTGKHLNPNFGDYKIPTFLDYPIDVEIIDSNVFYPANEINAKGIGEPPTIPVAPAIANAIYNATGIRFTSAPVTKERIIKGMKKQGEKL